MRPNQIDNMPADAEGPTPVILHLNSMSGAQVCIARALALA